MVTSHNAPVYFDIRNFVEFDSQNRAICPACQQDKGTDYTKRNLSVATNGAYKCHRGCTTQEIRDALGQSKPRIVPTALAAPVAAPTTTVSPQKIKESCELLLKSDNPARQWLNDRGIDDGMIARYQLGLTRSRCNGQMLQSISIPIPANADGTQFYQKKRVAPWLESPPPGYQPWSQKGIPASTWFTWKPVEATATYLCEGEWDAIALGWAMRQADIPIAVASFTCGCGTVPSDEQLSLLPGTVYIFYDRNDKPTKNGTRPGEEGAKKLAAALGDRARIAQVPMPESCTVKGWDVSDALKAGFKPSDFVSAAESATALQPEPIENNPLWARLQWNDELLDTAPDYTEWLVPDLLTANELFLLAAGPRTGKSLLAMTLALSVAKGELFLGRPTTQGTVLYIRMEDSPAKTKERETAQGWTRGLPVVWLDKFKLSELAHLRPIVERLDPRLIVIDTLSRVKDSQVSESSAEMSQVLEPLQELAGEFNCCVLLVHHTGKVSVDAADKIDIFDTIRGSSAIRAVCRGSLILAAGDRNFRLLAENGWGKHDLNILLDANTLQWRLLGHWNPMVNGEQKEMVLEFMRHTEKASLEELHEALNIPKRSLYTVLDRLQTTDIAGEKIVKEGKRRSYFYRLEHKDAIQQAEYLLNRRNPDDDCDRGLYSTKNTFFPENGSIIDQNSETGTIYAHEADRSEKSDLPVELPKTGVKQPSNPHEIREAQNPRSMIDQNPDALLLNKGAKTGSKPDTEGNAPIQQLFNSIQHVEYDCHTPSVIDPIQQQIFSGGIDRRIDPRKLALEEGDRVEICEGRFSGSRVKVVSILDNGLIEVKADRWLVTQKYERKDLKLLKRFTE
ncbi:MAG: AAA family ATPase [Leptolyngbya sp. UWPOB_LEPTO1]|uniref:bifunctional DNA primase/helicase n=1 Tax=Leptolyngbya sp. UWPOB_LEPTO1 TaxID=2815653 RepID=UPI001ACD8AB0|nr:bifunctional DNA primase/helicase [Leptolyngbya sp. UWPOB_LEPTO1]MBN8559958.1 AAA family ATPase [Leptolyngbya sp. UWPOB_LEPTO1]